MNTNQCVKKSIKKTHGNKLIIVCATFYTFSGKNVIQCFTGQ